MKMYNNEKIEYVVNQHHKTKNKRGYMHPLSALSHKFIQFSIDRQVADMGCAYGNTVIAALEAGADRLTACDMEREHLAIVKKRVIGKSYESRLITRHGQLPDRLDFVKESFDAIHASHVFGFLNGIEIDSTLTKFYHWLKPGGKLFILSYSIYTKKLDNIVFKTEYSKRKRDGIRWPGFLENYDSYCIFDTNTLDKNEVADRAVMPANLHMFELEILVSALEETGFTIEYAEYVDARSNGGFKEIWYDGREMAAVIAVKK